MLPRSFATILRHGAAQLDCLCERLARVLVAQDEDDLEIRPD